LFRVTVGNHSFTLQSNGSFSYTPPFYLKERRYRTEITPLNMVNLLSNSSFEEVFAGLPKDWNIGNVKDFRISLDKGYDGKYSLKVTTSSTKKRTWSWIRSESIDVELGRRYLMKFIIQMLVILVLMVILLMKSNGNVWLMYHAEKQELKRSIGRSSRTL